MRFLVDQNLSPRLATVLVEQGQDAVRAPDLGLDIAPDATVLDRARTEGRILISADSDFGTILAPTRAVRPHQSSTSDGFKVGEWSSSPT